VTWLDLVFLEELFERADPNEDPSADWHEGELTRSDQPAHLPF
jgi:hypothetical protein